MSFISILLGLIVDRYMPALSDHRGEGWYRQGFSLLLRHLPRQDSLSGIAFALVAVLLPTLLVMLLLEFVWSIQPLVGFVTGFAIFVFMLGPRSLFGDLTAYTEAVRRGDDDRARELAEAMLEATPPQDSVERSRHVVQRVLVLAGRRLFGVVFWAALLGPAGAVMFRAADILRHRAEEFGCPDRACGSAGRVYGILEWAPSRLLALSYALAGSFDEAMAERQAAYEACTGRFFEINEDILACTGRGALTLGEPGEGEIRELDATENLLFRTLVIWLAALALLSLLGFTL
ncbi:MAG: regulatory signaling modulator protein AmpE [Gammaproteobacteria bacterium]|nr:regulatory signaling modulator protein AmpE [Gammaproteobacteria bacterium]